MVKDILDRVNGINDRSEHMEARLAELVSEIANVAASFARIDAATQEQNDSIRQVAANQRQLDQSNQANAAAVGQASNQVRAFEGTVAQINQRIAEFRTESAGAATEQRASA
ncbi:hypothetical protein [Tropicibacter naphthalenivorans]|uniref:Methyl-accepting chemotaxis protein (MCP) signaling domain protein n=1 Tax=Tropicibacter naphthalenivorans TaxID=441103 RepID=A0A0P1G9X9_9RHOB|nr:hypothetical protein [Tropicibacter naphthalenivorans]CUH78274.1 Methyl-accepting chemotaxis protein (MCP) signaling domain protein [Tropicibacter naphthalenivorans]SMC78877.1 hypothetical protein SAMN04488093_10451 [Tropicibacter naphthalenivorans]